MLGDEFHILNFYGPNDRPLSLDTITLCEPNILAVGDFSGHSQSWTYSHTDRRGEVKKLALS